MDDSKPTPAPRWWEQADLEQALALYLKQGATAYNRTKMVLFGLLLGADLPGKTVLDYGGGAGPMSILCARRGANVVLVEPEAAALRLARYQIEREGLGARITCLQADHVPESLRGRRFDIVLLKDLLEHVPDEDGLLRDVAALQPPGGRLILSTPNRMSLNFLLEGTYERWWAGNKKWLGWDTSHVRIHSPGSLDRVLRRAGYAPAQWRGLYIIPYDIASWALLRRKKIMWRWLRYVDLWAGGVFPLNRCGWNVVLAAERLA
jgi:SAM-dependent methyltransferase